mmetsp:Transcript_9073/g.33463  ORF Transcript_9073/g.33463 Transcript_9073/m.33463 type:complete len:1362 (-) Transcript_9073:4213-8298(-)|eukprot:CAMPEP_0117454416 /NCGR_PEP_ID=MMETSP0759-20121206/10785_1 /TAXON_ID=63605 /ORGANISM="Percolomonas cosmopolitus, Strain WS" /LENGTH=1361 /DNA_ID=CAMNT_0005247593 /DNA_START=310 /DNA_END=4395 /DNA_ORIENTATION=-
MSSRDPNQFIDTEAEKESETHSNRADDSSENDSDVPDEFEQDNFITYDQEDENLSEEDDDEGNEENGASAGQKRKRHVPPGLMWPLDQEEEEPDRKKRKTGYKRLKKKKSALDEEEEEIPVRPTAFRDTEDADDMSNFIVGQSREDIVEQGGNSLAANIFGEEHPMEMHDEGAYIDETEEFYGEAVPEDKYNRLKKLFSLEALKSKYMTEGDDEIRETDIPERFQLRQGGRTVVTDELNREASWMLRQLYSDLIPVHNPQDDQYIQLHSQIVYVLKQIHMEHCDIPYITQYLKEYWSDRLTEDDLWKIYETDDKWFKLQDKKGVVRKLYDTSSTSVPQVYKDMLREASTMEEIKDLSQHFQLHYTSQNDMDILSTDAKKPVKRDQYTVAQKTPGFPELAKRMALSAHDYAHNLKSGIMLHFVEDPELMPEEMASTYTNRQFSTPGIVLKFVRHIHAFEISKEPFVRSVVRRCFEQYAEISTELTPKGRTAGAFKESSSKNLKNVSLQAFRASDEQHVEFMRIMKAKRDGLLKVDIRVPADQLDLALDPNANYHSDKTNDVAAAWNKQRTQIIEEVKSLLKKEMTDFVLDQYLKQGTGIVGKQVLNRAQKLLLRGPYTPTSEQNGVVPEGHKDLTKYSVVACAPGRTEDEPTAFVFLDPNGEIQETILWRFPPYMSREVRTGQVGDGNGDLRNDPPKTEQQLVQEKTLIFNIKRHNPDVIAVGASGLNCRKIYRVIEEIQKRISEENRVRMEFVPDEVARMYENSELASQEFKEIPSVVRRAISLGRYLNDPLSEIARLFNQEGDLFYMKIHPLQDMLRRSQLSRWIEQAFIRVVGQVGVDLNRAAMHRHLQSTLQFVSGLGPRKADALIKAVISRGELHTREDLKDAVEEHIFKNCSGFLRIQSTKNVEDEAAHFKPLDSTRVHPSSYQLAQKICLDALDADQDDEEEMDEQITSLMNMYDDDGNWVGAVPGSEEPDKLEDLDLDLYAQNLEDMGYGKKYITLRDIKEELKCPFKDPRSKFQRMTDKDVFYSATAETPDTFGEDSLVFLTISDVTYSRLFGYLDNGVRGFVVNINLPVNPGERLDQHYSVGQSLEAVVRKADYIAFSVELSAKEDDIERHHIIDPEAIPRLAEEGKTKKLFKRNITHPYFKNFDFKQAQEYLSTKPVGECVIRPSSKGLNHLSLTYKWYGGSVVSVDIKEEKKTTPFSLGDELWVKRQKFDDLDDLHYNLVELVIENADQVIQHPKYFEGSKEDITQRLRDEKKRNPKIIPYCLGLYSKYPGRFFIYYLPGQQTVLYEPIFVSANGFEFLGKPYPSPTKLINHFKKHYRDLPSLRRKQEAGRRGGGVQDNRAQVFAYKDSW